MAITGTGTQADPWVISTPQDLVTYSNTSSYWGSGKYTSLGADINMSGVSGFSPIGNGSTYYAGTFDGQGYVISNVTINMPSRGNVGLFGHTDDAKIRRIKCVGFDIEGGDNGVGGLVGGSIGPINIGGCTVDNCVVKSDGGYCVGGLIGDAIMDITIGGCAVENCIIEGSGDVGGLVGSLAGGGGGVSNCYVTDCTVSGDFEVGGLAGGAFAPRVSNCYVTDCTIEDSDFVGGLTGFAECSTISNCAVYGGTHGNVLVGGNDSSSITNCYTSNDVSSATFHTKGFWDGTGVSGTTYLSWDFTTPVWYWDSTKQLPVLQPTSSPVPNLKTKINGTWENASGMFTKVGGAWKSIDKAYVKVGGSWKQA